MSAARVSSDKACVVMLSTGSSCVAGRVESIFIIPLFKFSWQMLS